MGVVVVTPPEPSLDLETVKAHLNVEHDDHDAIIEAYIDAACAYVDGPAGILNRSIWAQTLELRQNVFCAPIRLPYGPVTEVVSVKYVDTDGVEQTLDDATYLLAGDEVVLAYDQNWPSLRGDTEGVRIRYEAGYDPTPRAVIQALLMLIAHWYANREAVNIGNITSELPMATQALLAPFRTWTV